MSWTDKLMNYNEEQSKKDEFERINFKFDLHFCKYIVELISDSIHFEYQGELLIKYKDKYINKEEFYYWWQITRYEEITKDQMKIKEKINDINVKLMKLEKMYPSENVNDNEEIKEKKKIKKDELDKKKNKILEFMKKDEPNVKKKLTLLNNFKLICPTINSLDKLLENVKIYIQYSHLRK